MLKLTDSERDNMREARNRTAIIQKASGLFSISEFRAFDAGFIAGLSHNQVKLDKLIVFIKAELTMGDSEIEEILQ